VKKENRYYASISCGAHSKLSRINPEFTCSVILRASELDVTPGPFLNRFEKYYVSYEVLWDYSLKFLPSALQTIMIAVKEKVSI
jgi:hypothetical protein